MLHVVTGAPASGKSTFVAQHAQPGDIRIDLDHITNLLAGMPENNWEHAPKALAVGRAARNAAIDTALKHSAEVDVWIIDSKPTPTNLARYMEHDAQVHTIDPGKDTVMSRVKRERPSRMMAVAAKWYDTTTAPTIKSFGWDNTTPGPGLHLDARHLPNPHDVPALRVPDGTSKRVGDWLNTHDEVRDFIETAINRIDREQPSAVWVGCNAGKHRSVHVSQELAAHYGTTAQHMSLKKPAKKIKSARERGYDWEHDKNRQRLLARHHEGTECAWCGEPMYRDKRKNPDGQALEADHNDPTPGNPNKADKTKKPKRLLHKRCNASKGEAVAEHGPLWYEKHQPQTVARESAADQPVAATGGTQTVW